MSARTALLVVGFLLSLAACGLDEPSETGRPGPSTPAGSWSPAPRSLDGLQAVARADQSRVAIFTTGGERDFIGGVNLGATVPGHFPAELAIERSDYARWFPQMAELGFTTIRIYTVHPPDFYEVLAAHNRQHPDSPLYLIQGVWPPEQQMAATGDLLHPQVTEGFAAELRRAVRVIHGEEPGYRTDISPWLAGWLIGYEWDPKLVAGTDAAHPDHSPHTGEWVSARPDATPTESWMASMLDHLAGAQSEQGTAAPLSFVNWPTTDPLDHPADISGYDDLVGIDANHIDASGWPAGMFVSYHAYPYFPDFIQEEPRLAELGGGDPYAGYLAALRDHHADLPVVVAEFGVPGGWGHAHSEAHGRTHGLHTEVDQMRINAEMLELIHRQALAGGLVFEWTDEWFKFTWNTLDFEQPPSRRIMWHNVFGAETWFGLLSVEPGLAPAVILDGDGGEWSGNGSRVVAASDGVVRHIRMLADPTFLSVRLVTAGPEPWQEEPLYLAFDLVEGGAPVPGEDAEPEADVLVTIGPGRQGRIDVRAHYDAFLRLYSARNDYVASEGERSPESWNPLRLLIQRPLTAPRGHSRPAEVLDVSALRFAPSDRDMEGFDSRAGWYGRGDIVEVRIPHMALGLADPSALRALRVTETGDLETVAIDGVRLTVVAGADVLEAERYRWQPWDVVTWHERLKQGSELLSAALATVNQAR